MKNRLKELRQSRQWSQADLARALGVSRQAVNGFKSGKFDPSLDMAFKIASLLDVSVEDIFMDEAKNSMPVLVERVKNFLGFKFGFERFTKSAIQAIQTARQEAVRLQAAQVEPAHLLTGLLADSTTTSAQLLRTHGATLQVAVQKQAFASDENVKLNAQSKFILELALQVVRLQGKRTIAPEHLLWGLVQLVELDRTVLSDLQRYNVDLEALKRQLAGVIYSK